MSLINDAIKQANKANKERAQSPGPATGQPTAGMQEAAPGRPPGGGSTSSLFLVAGIVLFVLLGGTLLFMAMRSRPAEDGYGAPPATATTSAPAVGQSPAVAPAGTQPTAPIPAETPAGSPVATQLTATPEPVVPVEIPEPVVPAAPEFPALKLQGIYYRVDRPSVMINGKTLEIGDIIADAKVIKIDRKDVTVEFQGQQKILRLQ